MSGDEPVAIIGRDCVDRGGRVKPSPRSKFLFRSKICSGQARVGILMAAAEFWFLLLWSRWRSLLVARSQWWLSVVAWLHSFTSLCSSARSMGWLCGGVIWVAVTGSVMDLTSIWERTGCRFRREDVNHSWRMVVRRIRQDGEGKTWSAAVVVSTSWIRYLNSGSSFMVTRTQILAGLWPRFFSACVERAGRSWDDPPNGILLWLDPIPVIAIFVSQVNLGGCPIRFLLVPLTCQSLLFGVRISRLRLVFWLVVVIP
ncbi:hypothetical protein ACLB2K_040760 [Fragaria x ananassa]